MLTEVAGNPDIFITVDGSLPTKENFAYSDTENKLSLKHFEVEATYGQNINIQVFGAEISNAFELEGIPSSYSIVAKPVDIFVPV